MVGDPFTSLMQSLPGLPAYDVLMEYLYKLTRYAGEKVGDESAKELAKKLVVQPLLKKLFGAKFEETNEIPAVTKTDFSARLIEYLERHDRALETTLQCLQQLADRITKLDASVAHNPTFVAIGLMPQAGHATQQANMQVQHVLEDRTPGLPQSMKSSYSQLHLLNGNTNLAEIYARSTLGINPVEAKAWYVLGILKLQQPVTDIAPLDADEAEKCLATAAEAGLAAQCALPRALLRVDHYMRRGRRERAPSLRELALLYGRRHQDAVGWPYGTLNSRLPTSREFRKIWF